jgi:hypothetical protein
MCQRALRPQQKGIQASSDLLGRWRGTGRSLSERSRGASRDHLGTYGIVSPQLSWYRAQSHTGIGRHALRHRDIPIVDRVGEDNGADHAMILGILDLQSPENGAVSDQGDLSLQFHAEINEARKIVSRSTAVPYVSRKFPYP